MAKISVDDSNSLLDMYSMNGRVDLLARTTRSILTVPQGEADYHFNGNCDKLGKGTGLSNAVSLKCQMTICVLST